MKQNAKAPRKTTAVLGLIPYANTRYVLKNCSIPEEARNLVQTLNDARSSMTEDLFYIEKDERFLFDEGTTH